jgi:AcrR family transcriptional regulator
MNASTRRDQYKRELRAVIVDAAREIFVRDGFEAFSMRKLASRVECSPGNIYLHFKNKEELFESLVEESFARLLRSLSRLRSLGMLGKGRTSADPVALLRKGLRAYVDFGLRNPNDYRFAFLIRPPIVKRGYKPHPAFEELRFMVDRCIAEKRFRAVDVETASQALWAAAHGITSLLIQRPAFPWVSKREVIAQVIDGAIESLLTVPASRAATGVYRANRKRHHA